MAGALVRAVPDTRVAGPARTAVCAAGDNPAVHHVLETVYTDVGHNLEAHLRLIAETAEAGCALVVFPELGVTGLNGSPEVTLGPTVPFQLATVAEHAQAV